MGPLQTALGVLILSGIAALGVAGLISLLFPFKIEERDHG